MSGVTFDTGALIAIERRKISFLQRLVRMREAGITITVPAVIVAEWWRGGSAQMWRKYMNGYVLEPTAVPITRLAGEAIAAIPGSTAVDAIVMASAALRGDIVYTGDFEDLSSLRRFFPSVRVIGI